MSSATVARSRTAALATVNLCVVVAVLAAACGAAAPSAGPNWTAIDNVPNAAGSTFAGVTGGSAGFVAVGGTPHQGEIGHAAVWTSADGRTWTAAADDPSFGQHQMLAVASGGSGFMAVGSSCATGECGANAAWASADGLAWHPTAPMAPVAGYVEVTLAVASGGPGWIVAGTQYGPADLSPPSLWSTADGSSWTPAIIVDPASGSDVSGVVGALASQGSRIVAVGTVRTSAGHRAAVWVSTDSKTWTRMADSDAFADGVMNAITGGGPGFVAVGRDNSGAAVWVSTDGSSWTKDAAGPAFSGAQMTSIATTTDDFVAVGYGDNGAESWSSADGRTWKLDPAAASMAGAQAVGVAARSGVDVAVGGATGTALAWMSGR